ncbi:hypothetical protein FRC17_001569 [Serendipita sp. 399]|nr:hypothetical protein FRC17_001569 [Serendipita sp. 399]
MSDPGYPPKSTENTASDDENGSSNSSSSTGSDDNDNNWDDWVEDAQEAPTFSLFEGRQFPSAEAALTHDKEVHGFDFASICKNLGLDTHQRLRLVNYIRRERPAASTLSNLMGSEPFLSDDKYLNPTLPDDPLLQLQVNEWSSDSDEETTPANPLGEGNESSELQILRRKYKRIQDRLAKAQQELIDYRRLVSSSLSNVKSIGGIDLDDVRKEDPPKAPSRDDDSHYFESYNEQAIHYIMLTDRVRTTTYATFILSNPSLFNGAVVMDVGCGTGILSLLAARAGAKKVIAVEASKIADKAEAIFKASGHADTITLVRGKVEELKTLPDGITHVDVIISEWMGYALLYESMLDSVLHARDRFLKPSMTPPSSIDQPTARGGVMAPSQCRMMLALCDPQAVIKQHLTFWNDVYGFNMSAMAAEVYNDAIIDLVPKECLLSASSLLKDLNLQEIQTKDLTFTSDFVLKVNELPTSPAAKAKSGNTYFMGKLHDHRIFATALVLWFDTFFHPDGTQHPPEVACKVHSEGDWETSDVLKLKPSAKRRKTLDQASAPPVLPADGASPAPAPAPASALVSTSPLAESTVGDSARTQTYIPQSTSPTIGFNRADRREESFTTGPHGTPTHWKQTVFLLKTPIELKTGTEIRGTFRCWKSIENSRELDVEIRFIAATTSASQEGPTNTNDQQTVQRFKVR